MKRKDFIRNATFLTGGLALYKQLGARSSRNQSMGCAPVSVSRLTGTITSVKDGLWSDFATWGGKQPTAGDTVAVNHAVTYDRPVGTYAGVNINQGASLTFDPSKSCQLVTTKNIVELGALIMKPSSKDVQHVITFTGINESNYVGGGMDVLDSDIGLWVMGNGRLDLAGTPKTSWTNLSDSLAKGSAIFPVKDATGWQAGDELAITPTAYNDYTGFDNLTIKNISGNAITATSTAYAHPKVNNMWTAEVINLTRNVRIEGTAAGKVHIFIRSTQPQSIKNVGLRFMGPRKQKDGKGAKNLVPGRYGLHFHHCMDGSRNSIVEGCIIRETDNHSYVPHASHGVTFRSNATYNTIETACWWDVKTFTHDVLFDGNLIALCKFQPGALDMDSEEGTGLTDPAFASEGMLLGPGDGNIAINNVVCGTGGDPGSAGAYTWEADNEGVWTFTNNRAHNNTVGIRTWQNTARNHVIEGTDIYHCDYAVGHGAYANSYTYKGGTMYGSMISCHGSSGDTNRVRFENISFDGGGLVDYGIAVISSPVPGTVPIFIRGCSFKNFKISGIVDAAVKELKNIDVIQCAAVGTLVKMHPTQISAQEVVRVQPVSGQATRVTKGGTINIPNFAPSIWGNGTGLKAEYFNNNSLSGSPVLTRIDSVVAFAEWGSIGVHYKITTPEYSVRWTGQVMPQYSENYTFQLNVAGGVRIWINGVQLADAWQERAEVMSPIKSIALQAGKYYDIKVEYFNSGDSNSKVGLYWQSPSLPLEFVPQSQLFPSGGSTPPVIVPPVQPPTERVPTLTLTCSPNPAKAGQDWKLEAVSSINGNIIVGITDANGKILNEITVKSGDVITTGAKAAKGYYFFTARQGTVKNSIKIQKL